MDKPPKVEGCLPLTSGRPPRRVARPERYEVDDTPLSPPGSNYLIFDSSSVFNHHPHKYRLLVSTPTGRDESAIDSSSKTTPSPLRHRRSKSLVSLRKLEEDSAKTELSSTSATLPSEHDKPSNKFRRPMQLPVKKIPGSVVPYLRPSVSTSALFGQDHYSHNKAEEGEDRLLRNFSDAVNIKEDRPVRFQIHGFDQSDDSMSSGSDTSSVEKKSSLPASEARSPRPKYTVKEVQPEPRRLFGFGPMYRPLPETVMETQQPLSEMVRKEGIRAVGVDATDTAQQNISTDVSKHKAVPSKTTKLESSVLGPFSF